MPKPTSTSAPVISSHLSPSSGNSSSAASAAPTIEPSVLTAYTVPIARSPAPFASNSRVISGSVMPAQNVAGSMTTRLSPYLASVNSSYPDDDGASACSRPACHENDATYNGIVATASVPISTCTSPSARTGSANVSARRRTHHAPSANPRMNAESISSNECVAAPSTSESMRIHAIS